MKVIKLNRRFKVHKARGHEVAVKFVSYIEARELELVCRARLGENFCKLLQFSVLESPLSLESTLATRVWLI